MSLALNDLERILVNEQKKCDDHLVIGGLEKFINNFKIQQQQAERAERVAQALQGYSTAAPEARHEMIARALAILRREDAPENVEPRETMPPPEPLDEFEDEDEEEETAAKQAAHAQRYPYPAMEWTRPSCACRTSDPRTRKNY